MSYSKTDTVKWRRILTSDMISSDSSGIEDTVPVLVAKEIPWRSRKVSSFFEKLDKFYEESKSEQAKQLQSLQAKYKLVLTIWKCHIYERIVHVISAYPVPGT